MEELVAVMLILMMITWRTIDSLVLWDFSSIVLVSTLFCIFHWHSHLY
jgi:hypothetical protein